MTEKKHIGIVEISAQHKNTINQFELIDTVKSLAAQGIDDIRMPDPRHHDQGGAIMMLAQDVEDAYLSILVDMESSYLARAIAGLQPACDRGNAIVNIGVPVSQIMHFRNGNKVKEQISLYAEFVALARKYFPVVQFMAQDATRAEPEYVAEVFRRMYESGATRFCYAESTEAPTHITKFGNLFRRVMDSIGSGNYDIGVHCHSNTSTAEEKSLEAVKLGASFVECAIDTGRYSPSGNWVEHASLDKTFAMIDAQPDYCTNVRRPEAV